jgi:hypothetical protein
MEVVSKKEYLHPIGRGKVSMEFLIGKRTFRNSEDGILIEKEELRRKGKETGDGGDGDDGGERKEGKRNEEKKEREEKDDGKDEKIKKIKKMEDIENISLGEEINVDGGYIYEEKKEDEEKKRKKEKEEETSERRRLKNISRFVDETLCSTGRGGTYTKRLFDLPEINLVPHNPPVISIPPSKRREDVDKGDGGEEERVSMRLVYDRPLPEKMK